MGIMSASREATYVPKTAFSMSACKSHPMFKSTVLQRLLYSAIDTDLDWSSSFWSSDRARSENVETLCLKAICQHMDPSVEGSMSTHFVTFSSEIADVVLLWFNMSMTLVAALVCHRLTQLVSHPRSASVCI
jgi:hypothetical protein